LIPTTANFQAKLYIDDVEQDKGGGLGTGSGSTVLDVNLRFRGKLNEGSHKVRITLNHSTGTLNINQDGNAGREGTSSLAITEFLGV
jgi:hypothetical protein